MADLRLMNATDAEWALANMARERWSSFPGWIHAHLAHDPDGCFVAEVDGERAGMVTSTAFARTGWIGNLIVAPAFRRHGLGNLLMERARERLVARGLGTIRIDADPPGMGIYRRMGFVERYDSLRFWVRDLAGRPHPSVRAMTPEDAPRVATFDRDRFGDDRGRFLELVTEMASHGVVAFDDSELTGYAFVVPTQDGVQLGPAVAAGREQAQALVETAIHDARSPAVVVGLPAANEAGCILLRELGFSESDPSVRMVWGDPSRGADDPTSIFAIASGACG